MVEDADDSELISTGKAARLCGVSTQTIVNWIRQGRLRAALTVGGRYRVYAESLAVLRKAQGFDDEGNDGRPRVYVVDDDEVWLAAARRQLNVLAAVETFTDGYLALLAIAARRPDLVVLDMRMPSIDTAGLLTALRIERVTADIPVLVATAFEEEAALARRLGATNAIVKSGPVSLKQAVEALLAAREVAK